MSTFSRQRLPGSTSTAGVGSYKEADIERRMGNFVRIGSIEKGGIDYEKRTARVKMGDNTTMMVPWRTTKAQGNVTWHPPDEEEQVIIMCVDGDLKRAVIMGALYKQDPGSGPFKKGSESGTLFKDGTVVKFDNESSEDTKTMPAAGKEVVTIGDKSRVTHTAQRVHHDAPLVKQNGDNIEQSATRNLLAEATKLNIQRGQKILLNSA